MKYVSEYRDAELAQTVAGAIAREADPERQYHFMEFCGGHTHAIFRYGVQDLMPANVHYVHGPGCPVCVLPVNRIDDAVELAERHGVILCSYGDMMRVPGTKQRSLIRAKADGADIRMVYSTMDALKNRLVSSSGKACVTSSTMSEARHHISKKTMSPVPVSSRSSRNDSRPILATSENTM